MLIACGKESQMASRLSLPLTITCVLGAFTLTAEAPVFAQIRPAVTGSGPNPTDVAPVEAPHEEDASINAIASVGTRYVWAVGDHGVIRYSDDGGETWKRQQSGLSITLSDVCFLTNQIGWIAGHETRPFTHQGSGVVLFTRDGGQHWQRLATERLPRIRRIEFFSLEDGMLVGDSSLDYASGILTTSDGGQTWQAVPGEVRRGWLASDFLEPGVGVVGGRDSQLTVVGGGRLLEPQFSITDDRSVRSIRADRNFHGWLVGDGAMVMKTTSGGVGWQPPAAALPKAIRLYSDFHAVDFRGEKVWIAGTPGSVIWHSPDGGQSWQAQKTGVTAPLNAIRFSNDNEGVAAGAFGTILKTHDGGKSWHAVAGGLRRSSMLVVVPRPDRLPLYLISQYAADQGYRTQVLIPSRDRMQRDRAETDADDRAADAVRMARGHGAHIDWRLPLSVPGVEHRQDQLMAEWRRVHEGDLSQVVMSQMVAQIRTWRPSLIVVDGGLKDDAVAGVIRAGIEEAMAAAGDVTRFPEQIRLTDLRPWQTRRLAVRLADGSQGTTTIDPSSVLPHLARSLRVFAADAFGCVLDRAPNQSEAFSQTRAQHDFGHNKPVGQNLFTGLSISPGSDARRRLTEVPDQELDRQMQLARRQKNYEAILNRSQEGSLIPEQMIANLHQMSAGMDARQAALQLAHLADRYEESGQWQLAEATRVELIQKYPNQSVSVAAMVWLIRLWSSSELAYVRLRDTTVSKTEFTIDPESIAASIAEANRQSQVRPRDREGYIPPGSRMVGQQSRNGSIDSRRVNLVPPTDAQGEVGTRSVRTGDRRAAAVSTWLNQASRMADLLERREVNVAHNPSMHFSLAALHRLRGNYQMSDAHIRRFQTVPDSHDWKPIALAEVWLQRPAGLPPIDLVASRQTYERPHLDGVLGDICWQNAAPLRLVDRTDGALKNNGETLVYLSHDDRYLYVAGNVRRAPGVVREMPISRGRHYDADLTGQDRLVLSFDVDRDYGVTYDIEIDQRGWTRDRCWTDSSWNPRYMVAADGQAESWSFEMAIPFEELVAVRPAPSSVWALGVSRVAPGVGVQSWRAPAAPVPRPESFGLLQFSAQPEVDRGLSN